jgi:murein DD-endopeptidase MepM/ murein hydrolase activator NlpD
MVRHNPVEVAIGLIAAGLTAAAGSAGYIALKKRKGQAGGGADGGLPTFNTEPTSFSIFGKVAPNWGGGYTTGAVGHRKRPFGNWESDNAWDVFAKPGTSVYSLTNGTVSFIKRATPGKNAKVYGDMIIIKGTGGDADMYYTHVDSAVKKGTPVKPGDLIGIILDPASAGSTPSMPPHVHIGMNDGTYVSNKADPSKSTGGGHISRFVREDGTILKARPAVA